MINLDAVPAIVKHMSFQIYKKRPKVRGGGMQRFLNCVRIAIANLAKNGYVAGGDANNPDKVQLTPAGVRLNKKHYGEGGRGNYKNLFFDRMYEIWQEQMEGERKKPKVVQAARPPQEGRKYPIGGRDADEI